MITLIFLGDVVGEPGRRALYRAVPELRAEFGADAVIVNGENAAGGRGITPPLALGMYAGMSIAGSDFKKTLINDLWWVLFQYILEVIMLMEWLPVFGL